MKIDVVGERAVRSHFRDPDEGPGRVTRRDRLRAEPPERHLRVGCRVLGSDAREPRARWTSRSRSGSSVSSTTGTTSRVHFKGKASRTRGHGFVGIGRLRLLQILQERGRAARRDDALRDGGRFHGRSLAGAPTSSSPPTASTPASASSTRTRSVRRSTFARTSSSGSALTSSSRRSPSRSWRRSTASCRRTPTASTPTRAPSSSSAPEATWRAFGGDSADLGAVDRAVREAVRRLPRRALADEQRASTGAGASGSPSRGSTTSSLAPREPGAPRRRRAHRALLDRLRDEARLRGRDRAGPRAPRPRHDRAGGAPGLPGAPAPGGAAAAERRAQQHRVVRDGAPLLASAARAVLLLAAHPEPAHRPPEPVGARPRVVRGLRAVVREARRSPSARRRRCSHRSRCAG